MKIPNPPKGKPISLSKPIRCADLPEPPLNAAMVIWDTSDGYSVIDFFPHTSRSFTAAVLNEGRAYYIRDGYSVTFEIMEPDPEPKRIAAIKAAAVDLSVDILRANIPDPAPIVRMMVWRIEGDVETLAEMFQSERKTTLQEIFNAHRAFYQDHGFFVTFSVGEAVR